MKTRVFEGIVTALSSIAHSGGESFGTQTLLRREKFVQTDGSAVEVPVVSGNAMRGMLRDIGMTHMCRAVYGNGDKLGLPAFHFLFSGGALTSTGGKTLDLEQFRRIRDLIPLVGVFGGAIGNAMIPGKLKCGKLIPVCAETAHLLPERYRPEDPRTIWDSLNREMYTRKDDAKDERRKALIEPGHVALIEAAEKSKRVDPDPVEGPTGQKQQMMYHVETFAAGTRFVWKVALDEPTEIEFEAFITTLAEFSRMPYIGGKSGTGLGEVSLKFDQWLEIDSRLSPDSREVAMPAGAAYANHLRERAGDIRDLLGGIA